MKPRQSPIEAEDLAWRREQARAEQARRDAARATAREWEDRERQAARTAEAVRQALPCEDCGRSQAAELCEACNHRRQAETLIGEAGLLAAAGSVGLTDPGSVAAATARARAAIGTSTAAAWQEFLEITDVATLEADREAAAGALRIHRVPDRTAGRRRVPGQCPGDAGRDRGSRS
ncbi:hypothetical protein [Streptomyces sp. NPDC045470]|uniref:hypothetical protein n=1 Tax=Streptomyces sp. NPDC045470 TaxID=3155469 RepID=UPI0033C5D0BA